MIAYALLAQLDRVFGYEPKGQGFESLAARHKRNLFCLPRQERFFLAFCAKYKANHRKMGFGAVDWLLKSPIFCFQRQKQSENAGVHIEFLCFASNY